MASPSHRIIAVDEHGDETDLDFEKDSSVPYEDRHIVDAKDIPKGTVQIVSVVDWN